VSAPLKHASVLLALSLTLSGCASSNVAQTRYRLALVSDSFASTLERLQQQEIAWHQAGQINAPDHAAWQRRIVRVAIAGKALNEALRAEPGATPVADRARVVVDLLDDLITEQVIKLSPQERQTANLLIESLRSTILIYSATAGD
jgi:ABC-type uncharacterized transport system auxiliary subunit